MSVKYIEGSGKPKSNEQIAEENFAAMMAVAETAEDLESFKTEIRLAVAELAELAEGA